MKKNDKQYDLLILLQPTSPLRLSKDIDNSIALLFLKEVRAIVSVCEDGRHPFGGNILPENGCMKNFIKPEIMNKNR